MEITDVARYCLVDIGNHLDTMSLIVAPSSARGLLEKRFEQVADGAWETIRYAFEIAFHSTDHTAAW